MDSADYFVEVEGDDYSHGRVEGDEDRSSEYSQDVSSSEAKIEDAHKSNTDDSEQDHYKESKRASARSQIYMKKGQKKG